MVFSSTVFLFLFLPAILVLYYNPFIRDRKFRNTILMIASLGFYAWGEPLFVFIMLFSIFINWLTGLMIDKQKKHNLKKLWLIISVIYNIGLIVIFKYLSFILNNINFLFHTKDVTIDIALPIGISFFTFQIMSYIFDVYYKKTKVQKNILNLALYISLFPQLIAGPIVRYETIADEIDNRHETSQDITNGMVRFVIGLGKKVFIANYLAVIADNIFNMIGGDLAITTAWLGAVAYALQIYFDFSGYSDMAIGLGLIFGFHFEENFNYPYTANSITDFWRRWHISLSLWFRDYIYIPLGGNRVKKYRWILNMLIVWLLTGIWHGANWTFIVWGLIYFFILVIEKLTGFTRKLKAFSRIYTLLFVLFAWIIFRAENLTDAVIYFKTMLGIDFYSFTDMQFNYYLYNGKWLLIIGIILCMPIIPLFKKKIIKNNKRAQIIYEIIRPFALIFVFIFSILICVKSTYNPFIYFNF